MWPPLGPYWEVPAVPTPAVPRGVEDAAEYFACGPLAARLSGVACAGRWRRWNRDCVSYETGGRIGNACVGCPAGEARARLLAPDAPPPPVPEDLARPALRTEPVVGADGDGELIDEVCNGRDDDCEEDVTMGLPDQLAELLHERAEFSAAEAIAALGWSKSRFYKTVGAWLAEDKRLLVRVGTGKAARYRSPVKASAALPSRLPVDFDDDCDGDAPAVDQAPVTHAPPDDAPAGEGHAGAPQAPSQAPVTCTAAPTADEPPPAASRPSAPPGLRRAPAVPLSGRVVQLGVSPPLIVIEVEGVEIEARIPGAELDRFRPLIGRRRVLLLGITDDPASERSCRSCGCTDAYGCPGGCTWAEADLCSTCAP